MTRLSFIVEGQPVTWKRAAQNGARKFTDARHRAAQAAIKAAANDNMRGRPLVSEPVAVSTEFVMKRAGVADLDNLQKLVLDALNTVVWVDDKQVFQLSGRKVSCTGTDVEPHTKIEVWSMNDA